MLYLCDSCILIDYLRGDDATHDILNADRKFGLGMSAVTMMELIVGAFNKREIQLIKKTFADFDILELNEAVSVRAKNLIEQYSKSHGLLIPDALIAATALEYDVPLFTANVSDFRFIPGLELKLK